MKLPKPIEDDLKAIERDLGSRGGQQAGVPRLRGLRSSIEDELLALHDVINEQKMQLEEYFELRASLKTIMRSE